MRIARNIVLSFSRVFSVALADLRSLSRARGLGFERTLFVSVLLIAVVLGWPSDSEESVARMNEYGAELFHGFLTGAYFAVFFLVPALFASAFSAERRSEDGLLIFTTPIRSVELVAGRFASHFLRVLVLLACGIPVLFSSTLFGGVSDWDLARAGIGLLSLSMMLAGLTMLLSILSGRAGTGGVSVIVLLIGHGFFVSIGAVILEVIGLYNFSRDYLPLAIPHGILLLGIIEPSGNMPGWVWTVSVIECAALGFLFLCVSAATLRPMSLRRLSTGVSGRAVPFWKKRVEPMRGAAMAGAPAPARGGVYRGPVWNNPVAWKEFRIPVGGANRFDKWTGGLLLWGGLPVLVLMLILSGIPLVYAHTMLIGFELAVVSLLVLSRSAVAMTREFERKEFETLAVTPLSAMTVLSGKWAGLLRSVIPMAVVMCVHFAAWSLASIMPETSFTDYLSLPERFLPPLLCLISIVASVTAVGSIGLAVSVSFSRSSTATAVASGAVLTWWLGIPLVMALMRAEWFLEITGACNPFYVCIRWASVYDRGFDRISDELALPTLFLLAFTAALIVSMSLWFMGRFNRGYGRT